MRLAEPPRLLAAKTFRPSFPRYHLPCLQKHTAPYAAKSAFETKQKTGAAARKYPTTTGCAAVAYWRVQYPMYADYSGYRLGKTEGGKIAGRSGYIWINLHRGMVR